MKTVGDLTKSEATSSSAFNDVSEDVKRVESLLIDNTANAEESTRISRNATAPDSQIMRVVSSKYTIHSKQAAIFEALSSFDINKLMSILNKIDVQDSLHIVSITDEGGHTLIHRAAYDNTYRISEYLIQFYKQRLSAHLR